MAECLHQTTSSPCHLCIPTDLSGNRTAAITAMDPLSASLLRELSTCMQTDCLPGIPAHCHVFLQTDPAAERLTRTRQGSQIKITYPATYIHDNRESFLLRECVFSALTMAIYLHDPDMALFHGTFLEENEQEGILLFGESGIGKSTTRMRWLQEGGASCADDALLLFVHDDRYYVRPLPTWSHWLLNGNDRRYPVRHAFRVREMYWLSRDPERQRIAPAEPARYHCQLLSAMLLHTYSPRRNFSDAETRDLGEKAWEFIRHLDEVFPARTLRAHLDWPLKDTFYNGDR